MWDDCIGENEMLLTVDELLALANLLSRAPMSPAERLWSQALVNRLDAARAAAANAAAQPPVNPEPPSPV